MGSNAESNEKVIQAAMQTVMQTGGESLSFIYLLVIVRD